MPKLTAPDVKLNPPADAGVYWARGSGYRFWNFMVRVYGNSPYFRIDVWDILNHKFYHDANFVDIKEFGPALYVGVVPDVDGDRKDWYQ